ncbi:MAG TPA: DUF5818 domain-containing protein [Candidatus Acidoferrales bacterium]|jgi:hypothetical protein|nr:DUF5818 domain-containing protein [Candidatus Acidoferrales bacterium]
MKRGTALFALGLLLSSGIIAADFSGYVIDESCASKPAMKGNEACARKCIKGGSPAVLLTADAKVYKLDDQAKAVEHAGHKVKITGALDGDTIKIESINVDSGCVPGPTGCQ